MTLNELGKIAKKEWMIAETIRDTVSINAFVIMTNHIHCIIKITMNTTFEMLNQIPLINLPRKTSCIIYKS